MKKPPELEEAELIDALCQRWGQRPSVLLDEEPVDSIGIVAIVAAGMVDAE